MKKRTKEFRLKEDREKKKFTIIFMSLLLIVILLAVIVIVFFIGEEETSLQPTPTKSGNHKSPLKLRGSIDKDDSRDYFTDIQGNPRDLNLMPQQIKDKIRELAIRNDMISPVWAQRAGNDNPAVYHFIKQYNPNIILLEYANTFNFAGNIFSLDDPVQTAGLGESAYLHMPLSNIDSTHRIVPRFHSCTDNTPMYDLGNNNFVNFFMKEVTDSVNLCYTVNNVKYCADGLWVDNSGIRTDDPFQVRRKDTCNTQDPLNPVDKVDPLNPRTGTAYTGCQQHTEALNIAQKIRTGINNAYPGGLHPVTGRPIYLSPNIGGEILQTSLCNSGDPLGQIVAWDLIEQYGGIQSEGGGWFAPNDGPLAFNEWKLQIDNVKEAMDRGVFWVYMPKKYFCNSVLWPSESRLMFTYTSALLAAGRIQDDFFFKYDMGDDTNIWPGFDVDIGYAIGDYFLWPGSNTGCTNCGVYARQYGKALVLVNPYSTSRSINLNAINSGSTFRYKMLDDKTKPGSVCSGSERPDVMQWTDLQSIPVATSGQLSVGGYIGEILLIDSPILCDNDNVCEAGETVDSCSNDCKYGVSAAQNVPKWSVYETSLTATGTYTNPNPYIQASVTAQFTGPNAEQKTVKGFWDGNDAAGKSIFKLRFTPTKEGTWSYTTTSTDAGLNGKSGSLNVIAPLSTNKGFVRFDPANLRHFAFDNGEKYFMFGQTYYEIIDNAIAGDNWKTAIDNSKLNGMNKVRMLLIPWHTGEADGRKYASSSPFVSGNHDSLNLAHWKKFDEVIKYLDSKGMMAEIVIFADPPADAFKTITQDKRYLRYAIARFASYPNVVWSLTNEWEFTCLDSASPEIDCINKFENFGNIVRDEDPWGKEGNALRALSVHQLTKIDFSWFSTNTVNSLWPSHASFQFGVRSKPASTYNFGDKWGNAGILNNLLLIKNPNQLPVVNDEYGYVGQFTGESASGGEGGPDDRKDHRNTIWSIYTGGGYGTFGDIRPFDNSVVILSSDWHDAPEYGDVKRLVDFFTTRGIEYWKMTGKNSIVSSGTRVYALGQDGVAYVVYAANGGGFTLDLPPVTGIVTYKVIEYNPATGAEISLADMTEAPKSFSYNSDDKVLLIRASGFCGDNDGVCPVGCSSSQDVDCSTTCTAAALGSAEYCDSLNCGPCSHGQGDCDGNIECVLGTECIDDIGATYGFLATRDVCVSTACVDNDRDNYGVGCVKGADCDDRPNGADGIPGNADDGKNINSGVAEICGDGIDNNCAGGIDENCPANCLTADSALKMRMSFDIDESVSGIVNDESLNNADGTIEGAVLWTSGGKYGGAYTFDADGERINLGDYKGIENKNTLTVSVWAKSNTATIGGSEYIVGDNDKNSLAENSVNLLERFDEKFSFSVRNSAGATAEAIADNANADTSWHHVVGVYDGNNVKLYVDDVLQSSQPALTGPTNTGANSLYIGGAKQLSSTFYGLIDDVFMFDRVLTQSEIDKLFNGQYCNTLSCTDVDGDGYGVGCALGPDCRDDLFNVNPGEFEICDADDNDCDNLNNYFDACAFVHGIEAEVL